MSKADNDISSLFKHLGTSSEHYQEITRSNEARESETRWPLLASIHALASAAPVVVPAVTRATSPLRDQHAQGLVNVAAPAAAACAETASQPEPSIALPALLHTTPEVGPPTKSPVQMQASAAPARRAEFIAPRPKSLATTAKRDAAHSVEHESAPTLRTGTHAVTSPPAAPDVSVPLAAETSGGTNKSQIEGMFARLAKPEVLPPAEQPTDALEPTPAASGPEPKRSLFERLIGK